MKDTTIAFIGGGNMAVSLIGGLLVDCCSADKIWVTDPDEMKLAALRERFSVNTATSNQEAAALAQVIILAVKPQVLKRVAQDIAPVVQTRMPLVISIAAGVREPAITAWLGGHVAVVRTMPNTPALVRSGATALYANAQVTSEQRSLAESILRAVGLTLWVEDEAQMDAVTALSGSGPAYIFQVMEAMETAGIKLGLAPATARLLTLQTAFGATKMALESAEDSATLRARVTSPGGTTEQAIKVLQEGHIQELFDAALQVAHARSVELAVLLEAS